MAYCKCIVGIIILSGYILAQGLEQIGTPRQSRRSNRGIEIGGSYGYQFGGCFTVYDGDANIIDTKNYGFYFVFPLPVGRGKQLEINYSRQDTQLELKTYQSGNLQETTQEIITDLTIDYYQVGGVTQFFTRSKRFVPYGIVTLGATRYHPKSPEYTDDKWMLAVTFGGGIKIFFREKIGLRFQGRMLLPINWGGSSKWFRAQGSQIGVSGGSTVLQADLSAGLFFVL